MDRLILQTEGPVARVLIHHPARRNAFTHAMWQAIPALVAQALATPGVRVLTLESSTPGAFAAGADISEMEVGHVSRATAEAWAKEIADGIGAFADCPLPVIAFIDGPCVGGGLALAAACDWRVATPRARFAITPAKLGLAYSPADLRRLVQACGRAAAAELLFTGAPWSAERAFDVGLLNQLVAAEALPVLREQLTSAIAANSLDAMTATKRGLRAVLAGEPDLLDAAQEEFLGLFSRPDFEEGRSAFLQKRPAQFPSHEDGAS
ncbi:MAG: hypothetical protein EOO29_00685 [Comamonadaceae bacterium]|nr:MAG: hypothetical protein EOO29_00685 [Comamonadaceae bacterium]